MRSRPIVRVLLGSSPLEPGARVDVDVALTSRSETPTEHVDVSLTGEVLVIIPQGKTSASRGRAIMPRQTFRWKPGELTRGDYRQRFHFALPADVPPSHYVAGGFGRVVYTIEVHVAIPLWIDRRASFSLPVAALRAAAAGQHVDDHGNAPERTARGRDVHRGLGGHDAARAGR